MNNPEIQAYLSAAAALMNKAIAQARQDEPEAAVGLANILRAGGLMRVVSTFAHSTRQAHVLLEVIAPNGDALELMSADIEPEHTA
jgi:hypothetical protein